MAKKAENTSPVIHYGKDEEYEEYRECQIRCVRDTGNVEGHFMQISKDNEVTADARSDDANTLLHVRAFESDKEEKLIIIASVGEPRKVISHEGNETVTATEEINIEQFITLKDVLKPSYKNILFKQIPLSRGSEFCNIVPYKEKGDGVKLASDERGNMHLVATDKTDGQGIVFQLKVI